MPTLVPIQHRRDTAAQWTSLNPTLLEGELGYETDTGKFKIGRVVSGSLVAWNSLDYQRSVLTTSDPLALTEQQLSLKLGTGLVVSGGNLVPDFGTTSGKVLDGAHAGATNVHSIGSGNSVVGTGTSQSLSNKTIINSKDKINVVASAATGTINVYTDTAQVWFYSTAVSATAPYTLNIKAASGTNLNDRLADGEAITVTFMHKNGASTTAYPNTFQIDGTTLTGATKILWQVDLPPAGGDAGAINTYTLTILRNSSGNFTVLGSQSKFI